VDVVVAGAGIGGAAAALLLARYGARVTLLERVAEPRAVGAGILLQPNGLAVLYGLGLRDALAARARVGREIRVADADGRLLAGTPIPDLGGGFDHVLVLRRSHLLAVLLDAVRNEPGIACRLGCEVTGADREGNVGWRGPAGDERMRADIVVGADGLHSCVRGAGGFDAVVTPGPTYVRGLGRVEARSGPMTEYWTSVGIFGAGAVDGATYFYASTAAPPLAAALARRDLDTLRAVWREACPAAGEAFDGVERIDDLLVNQVTRVDCARWHDDRLVLLGDAAHAMAPNLGQGANSALVDAVVLADALATHREVGSALAAYDARRRPAVRRIQDAAALLARLGELRSPLARTMRDGAVRLLSRLGSDRSFRRAQQEEPTWLERRAAHPSS
jgi:2-polyprenyl-6-methoxyphenol hydroxylase-like FAD-dependent oxidoreductase